MNQSELEALLGRPLTSTEVANLKLYLNIAEQSLEELICMDLSKISETREYEIREGYRTLFTDVFTDVSKVEIDGETIDPSKYSKRQWDRRNGKWYNSIVFTERMNCNVEITADWGFDCYPNDLQSLLAKLFSQISAKNTTNTRIQSKEIEDFKVTYKSDGSLDEQLASENAAIISKYSLCGIGQIRNGRVCEDDYRNRIRIIR